MMKIIRICFVGLMLMAASCATMKNFPLVKDGKTASCIVLPDNAGPVEKHAAVELAAYLEKITGAKVETVASPSNEKYNIYIGTRGSKKLPLTSKMKSSADKLGEDGYMLAADAGGLRVVGQNSRGVLYGIYGLLKKYGNVRWFFPGPEGEYCPRSPNFLVSSGVTISNPSFQYRTLNLCCANMNSKMTDTWDWMVRNGMQMACRWETSKARRKELDRYPEEREKRGDENVGGGHSFSYLISDNLFDAHPEYFALIDGKRTPQGASTGDGTEKQPCTSNPKVVEIMTEKLIEWGEIPPRGGSFLIGNNDSPVWCQCENCVKLDPPEEREKHFVSTRYWTLLNAMADKALAKNPELKLKGWAYQNFQEPPVGIVPDKRLSVVTCLHQRCYRHRMDDENCASNKRFRDMLVNWVKLNPISTYEYTDCLSGGDVIYLPLEHVFAHDLKYYHQIGVRGSLTETVPPDGVFGPALDNRGTKEMWLATWQFVYMMAYFLWDVDADYAAVYEDMGSKFYGVAWPVMKQYRAKLATAWEETPGDMIYGTPNIALGKCLERPGLETDLLKLLNDAEKTAAGDEALLKKIRREREYFALSWQKMHKEYVAQSKLEVGASRCVEKITIDGKLDEKEWGKAEFISGFIALEKGDKADPQTFVRILYDKDNIYFGVESLEPELSRMKVVCVKKDGRVWEDNDIEIFLAAPAGAVKYLHLVVNSAGVVYDSMTTGTGFTDVGFDSRAEVKTATLPDRWVLEARIPTSALGSSTKDGEVWKVNVARCRVLTDGALRGSSLCGVFHGVEFFRSIAFGGKGLIQNGDFEDVQKPSTWKEAQREKWVFKTDAAPSQWNFHQLAGEAELIEGSTASGRKFLRVKSFTNANGQASIACIVQYRLAIKEADTLLVRAKVRGKGEFTAYGWRYNFDTGRPATNFSSQIGATLKIDSTEWTPFEGVYHYDGNTFLALAFYFVSLQGIDLDDVTITRWKNMDGLAGQN